MHGLFGKNGLKDVGALLLVRVSFVGLRCGDVESQRVEDGGLGIVRIGSLEFTHLFLEGLGVSILVFAVLTVNLADGVNVGLLGSGLLVAGRSLLGLDPCCAAGVQVAAVPQ